MSWGRGGEGRGGGSYEHRQDLDFIVPSLAAHASSGIRLLDENVNTIRPFFVCA